MPSRTKTRGSGITEKKVTVYEMPLTDEEMEQLKVDMKEWSSREYSFEGLYGKRAEAWAREILEAADLDPGKQMERFHTLEYLQRLTRERKDSIEIDYAARLLDALRLVRACVERGDIEDVARLAVEFGLLLQEMAMKFKWERDALSGVSYRLNFKAGRDEYNKQRKREAAEQYRWFQTLADELWEKRANWSRNAVACMMKKLQPDLPSIQTIRKHIKKQK